MSSSNLTYFFGGEGAKKGGAKHAQHADGFAQSPRDLNLISRFQLEWRLLLPSLRAGSHGVLVGVLLLLTMGVMVIPVPPVAVRSETVLKVSSCSEMAERGGLRPRGCSHIHSPGLVYP